MEPGGESTQYESIRTVTKTPPKQKGQLGGGKANEKNTVSELKILSDDKNDEQWDTRQDPNLQDPQFAGTTSNVSGEADRDLKPDAKGIDEEARRTRTAQRLGPGSGIGA